MIDDLSQTLRVMLSRVGPEPLRSAQIVFDRPADTFNPQQMTVNLFLYDVREDAELRSNEPIIERMNGQVITHRPPLRVACSYLITAWSGGLAGDEAVFLEQKLLGQILQVLAGQPTIDRTLLQGSLGTQSLPVPVVTAAPTSDRNLSEFWTALGNKLRASLTVKVTVAMEDVFKPETTHLVAVNHVELSERTNSN